MIRSSKPRWVKELALKRILTLLGLAEKSAKTNPARARRYVELARKLSSRYNVTISHEWKRRFCKRCGALWVHGMNVVVRAERGKMFYTCKACGAKRSLGRPQSKPHN